MWTTALGVEVRWARKKSLLEKQALMNDQSAQQSATFERIADGWAGMLSVSARTVT
jgi:hypothetical protein